MTTHVTCIYCGNGYKFIPSTHLAKHGITKDEYIAAGVGIACLTSGNLPLLQLVEERAISSQASNGSGEPVRVEEGSETTSRAKAVMDARVPRGLNYQVQDIVQSTGKPVCGDKELRKDIEE